MVKEELLSGLADLSAGVITVASARSYRAALESGGGSVEDKNRLCPEEEELADPTEEAEDVGVVDHFPLFVPHRLHELDHPYARV